MVGDRICYRVGREGGRPFVPGWGHYVRITPERLDFTGFRVLLEAALSVAPFC